MYFVLCARRVAGVSGITPGRNVIKFFFLVTYRDEWEKLRRRFIIWKHARGKVRAQSRSRRFRAQTRPNASPSRCIYSGTEPATIVLMVSVIDYWTVIETQKKKNVHGFLHQVNKPGTWTFRITLVGSRDIRSLKLNASWVRGVVLSQCCR